MAVEPISIFPNQIVQISHKYFSPPYFLEYSLQNMYSVYLLGVLILYYLNLLGIN